MTSLTTMSACMNSASGDSVSAPFSTTSPPMSGSLPQLLKCFHPASRLAFRSSVARQQNRGHGRVRQQIAIPFDPLPDHRRRRANLDHPASHQQRVVQPCGAHVADAQIGYGVHTVAGFGRTARSEENTTEIQSLMRNTYDLL